MTTDPTIRLNPIRDLDGDVEYEAYRLKVRKLAKERHESGLRTERGHDLVELERLDVLLAADVPDPGFRIEGLLPFRGRAMLTAAFKTGKSTLVANLVRSLCDGDPFLDQFAVNGCIGATVVLDAELDRSTLRHWLKDQNIKDPKGVSLVNLRGRLSAFDILDDKVRDLWVNRLREADAEVVILDPLAPILSSLGLDEDRASDVGQFLAAFDELLAGAKVDEAVIVHHTGHAGERGRGSIRLRDWPDAEWRLVRDGDDDMPPQDRRRYLTAIGRDVDVPESLLAYDPDTRRLAVAGGSRKQTQADQLVPEVLTYCEANEGSSGRQIEAALHSQGHTRAAVRDAIKSAVRTAQLDTSSGPRGAVLHFVTSVRRSAPPVRQHGEGECASAPIEGALHSHSRPATSQLASGALESLPTTEQEIPA